ncbi:MAG: hypothetical protein AB1540_09805 [Bdellovibrionota bacterium]
MHQLIRILLFLIPLSSSSMAVATGGWAGDRNRCETELKLFHPLTLPRFRPNDGEGGLVSRRVDLSMQSMLEAYSNGIFP